jgi:hypothetical protein
MCNVSQAIGTGEQQQTRNNMVNLVSSYLRAQYSHCSASEERWEEHSG